METAFLHRRGNDWYLLTVLEESGQDRALLAQEPVRGLWAVFDESGRLGYAPNHPQAQWVQPEIEAPCLGFAWLDSEGRVRMSVPVTHTTIGSVPDLIFGDPLRQLDPEIFPNPVWVVLNFEHAVIPYFYVLRPEDIERNRLIWHVYPTMPVCGIICISGGNITKHHFDCAVSAERLMPLFKLLNISLDIDPGVFPSTWAPVVNSLVDAARDLFALLKRG